MGPVQEHKFLLLNHQEYFAVPIHTPAVFHPKQALQEENDGSHKVSPSFYLDR